MRKGRVDFERIPKDLPSSVSKAICKLPSEVVSLHSFPCVSHTVIVYGPPGTIVSNEPRLLGMSISMAGVNGFSSFEVIT